MNSPFDALYWQNRYTNEETGWDIGYVSPPLKEYFDQLKDSSLRLLIPGAGNSYETEYLYSKGFQNVTVLDMAEIPLRNLERRIPGFPKENLVHQDFFHHEGLYDLIIEQTFFCALVPSLRPLYAQKMHSMLVPGGKLAGVLFDDEMKDRTGPPFGGTRDEYIRYFEPLFHLAVFDRCYNSIEARKNREFFIILERR